MKPMTGSQDNDEIATIAGGRFLSVDQAARELEISAHNLRIWIQRRELKATKMGGNWIIERDDLEDFRRRWKTNKRVMAGKENATRRPRFGGF